MHNVNFEVKAGKLIITCDVSEAALKKATPSATGKTHLVASTSGIERIPQLNGKDVSFSLNVMQKRT